MSIEPQLDSLTGLMTRPALLDTLFRETDRAQRSRQPLSLIQLAVDDFEHWKSRLTRTQCDALIQAVAERISRMLRSYDAFGRVSEHEFLLIVPGCSVQNANLLAERLRVEVFAAPIAAGDDLLRLSACFGIASSEGRSPVVVLQEAESALHGAQKAGPESIRTFARGSHTENEPVEFLS